MTQSVNKVLEYCRNVLWWIIVENAKGQLPLTDDQKARIDQAERIAAQALKDITQSENDDEL